MGEALLLRELDERDEGPSSRERTTLPAHRSTDREGNTFEALSAVVSRASFPDAASVAFSRSEFASSDEPSEREGQSAGWSSSGGRASRRVEWAVDDGAAMHIHSTSELWTHLTAGTLSPLVLVWREGMEAWEPAFRLPELACAIVGFDPARAAEGLDLGAPSDATARGDDALGATPTFGDLLEGLADDLPDDGAGDDSLKTPEPHALGATPVPPSVSDGTPPPASGVRVKSPELRRAGVGGLVGIALGTAFAAVLAVAAAPARPARAEAGLLPALATAAEGARALATAAGAPELEPTHVRVGGPVELVVAPAGGESALALEPGDASEAPNEAANEATRPDAPSDAARDVYAAKRPDERGRKRRRAR